MNTRLGLLGIFGIWATMAMMPIAELLPLNAYQLLALRGGSGCVVIGLAWFFNIRSVGSIEWPDRHMLASAALFVLASVGLFQAIKAWGANLSAVLLDMAVLVNFAFAVSRGEGVSLVNFTCFATAIVGSFLALRGWAPRGINFAGFAWSLLALVANGLFIEYASRAKQDKPTKVFWLSFALVAAGVLASLTESWQIPGNLLWLALWFGIATGLLNFICAFTAFANLSPVWTGTLVLGVTPSILIASYFITGKMLGSDQLVGIVIILVSVGYLGNHLRGTPAVAVPQPSSA